MPNSKEIKSRIKSVKNTGKITKAMELISTVKMKKAQEAVVGLRPFALATLAILAKIAQNDDVLGIFAKSPKVTKELIVLVAAQK